MNVRISRPGLGPIRNMPRAVAHRWPALAVATVAAGVPMAVAFANGPAVFQTDGASPAITAVGDVFVNNGRVKITGLAFDAPLQVTADRNMAMLASTNSGNGLTVATTGQFNPGAGVSAKSNNGDGVDATGSSMGVKAVSTGTGATSIGVQGTGSAKGVEGKTDSGVGVSASSNSGTAVTATSTDGTAVDASTRKTAVQARSFTGTAVAASSGGTNTVAVSAYADQPGTMGVNAFGASMGVYGEGGTGVVGHSNTGLGAEFSGPEAPVRLAPSTTKGAPTSGTHKRGELYVDNQGQLFLCVADSTNGSAGTWKKVVLQ